MLTVLIIAPEVKGQPPLAVWSEIDQICDIHNVDADIVSGPTVTRAKISRKLQCDQYDVVLWSGHGLAGELLVSGDDNGVEVITPGWLANQLHLNQPKLVVLAACWSSQVDRETLRSFTSEISASGVNVVGMTIEVEDQAAIVYDVEVVRAMAAGADPLAAHNIALAQMASCYPDMAEAPVLMPGMARLQEPDRLTVQLERIERKLDATLELVEGMADADEIKQQLMAHLKNSQDNLVRVVEALGGGGHGTQDSQGRRVR